MPAVATLPSGTRVERLCGQPEQKVGRAHQLAGGARGPGLDDVRRRVEPRRQRLGLRHAAGAQALHEDAGDDVGVELAGRGHQRPPPLVALAGQARAAPRVDAEQQPRELVLDHRPLLLDDEDLLVAGTEVENARGLEGPRHGHLVDADAEPFGAGVVDAEAGERGADIEIGLAAGDDAEAAMAAAERDPVHAVGGSEGARRVEPGTQRPRLLVERRIHGTDVEPAFGHLEILGHDDRRVRGIDRDGGAALDDVGDAFEADPAAGEPRQRDAEQAVVEELGHAGGVEHRHGEVDEGVVALVGQGRGARAVVVAGQGEDAAAGVAAGEIAVLHGVARAVEPGTLAVPQAEHALAGGQWIERRLLAAPQRGRGEVLVHAGLEVDAVRLEARPGAPQLAVVGGQRRAAIAGDEAGRVQPRREVAAPLRQRQAHQRLDAGEVDAALVERVFVVQRDRREHGRRPV